jgi:hypothetical protein
VTGNSPSIAVPPGHIFPTVYEDKRFMLHAWVYTES